MNKCLPFFILLLFGKSTYCQLCSGSLGDPIVNITFGAGNNPGPSLAAASVNYYYVAGDCPNDGGYTIANQSSGCFRDNWHTISSDHTGNANGYFMLVNASFEPSTFYVDTVHGLCSNTTFELAAWVMNVPKLLGVCGVNSIKPNLTFTVEKTDGTILKTYNTGNLSETSSPIWNQYGFYFTTPSGVSDVVLRIANNAPGGCGNDLALDDITFRPCGPKTSVNIVNNLADSVNLCIGDSKNYSFNTKISAGFNTPSFQWQSSSDGLNFSNIENATSDMYTTNFARFDTAAKYFFRIGAAEKHNISVAHCRTISNIVSLIIHPNPDMNLQSNAPICARQPLNISGSGMYAYSWTANNGFSSSQKSIVIASAALTDSGMYYVTATSPYNCSIKDSIYIKILPTPNAVVSNDTAICSGNQVQLYSTGGIKYSWSPAAGLSDKNISNPIAAPLNTTLYKVIMANESNCTDTAEVTISIYKVPQAFVGVEKEVYLLKGSSFQLHGKVMGDSINYFWQPLLADTANAISLDPIVSPVINTLYTLNVVSEVGCNIARDSVQFFVVNNIYVPNAFTPNHDGINDTWEVPVLKGLKQVVLQVYNRFGEIVFEYNKFNTRWNGRYKGKGVEQPAGLYVYTLEVKDFGITRKGTISLIR